MKPGNSAEDKTLTTRKIATGKTQCRCSAGTDQMTVEMFERRQDQLLALLSNMVLKELDHELEKRGLRYCRWDDDFLILPKSERAA
jgi:hypothetical protein